MKRTEFSRYAPYICAAAAMLAGCGGSQPPIGAPGAMPQSPAIATHIARGGSWMLPGARRYKALIYVTDGCGGTCVLSYPEGKLVGSLKAGAYYNSGACTDKKGDIFISSYDSVVEYPRGGTSPIATYSLPGNQAKGCAIDRATDALAVVFVGADEDVAIFAPGSGTPKVYASGLQSFSCTYDDLGNLLIGGYNGQQTALAELPKGGSQFSTISIGNGAIAVPGQVQWNGGYVTFESIGRKATFVYRLAVSGSTATIVGKTHIEGTTHAYYSWIYGSNILVPYSTQGPDAQRVGIWRYPQGGKPVVKFQHFAGPSARLQSVTISP